MVVYRCYYRNIRYVIYKGYKNRILRREYLIEKLVIRRKETLKF